MSLIISPYYTQRTHRWTDWKTVQSIKNYVLQYEEDALAYTIWGYDGPEIHTCKIYKGSIAYTETDYTQQQNDDDKSDFETNYKNNDAANAAIMPKSKDGRHAVRYTAANRTKNFKLRVFSFYSGKLLSNALVHNVNPVTDADYNDITVKIYNAQGGEITSSLLQSTSVKTVIDWEPTYDFEIIGGYLDTPSSLKDGSSDAWFLSVIGVPDYTIDQGGSVDYISETNLEAVTTQQMNSDGRAISFMAYNYGGAPHTNKMRFVLKHPAGASKRFQFYVEHYV